jgi:hypothetical protein
MEDRILESRRKITFHAPFDGKYSLNEHGSVNIYDYWRFGWVEPRLLPPPLPPCGNGFAEVMT